MSKRMNCNIGNMPEILRKSIVTNCLLLAIAGGSIVTSTLAQSMSVLENTPMTQSPGESSSNASSNAVLPIASVAEADRLLKDVEAQRGSINARYRDEEARCLTRFFVTSCIDDAKERRRVGLRSIRSIEVQANAFKRSFKAEQRDRQLQQKQPSSFPRSGMPRLKGADSHPDNT